MITESRSSLYYGLYKYAISWTQDEIGCVRSLDQNKMLSHIRVRMDYEHRRNSQYNPAGGFGHSRFTTRCRSNLESARAFLAAETEPKKLVFCNNTITVYTNDAGLHNRLIDYEWAGRVYYRQAALDLPADTILLKNPQYQYRTYFRGRTFGKQQKARLTTWIQTQGKEIAASKSLRTFLEIEPKPTRTLWWRNDNTESYYYIEHNSLQYETLLSMICQCMVRKTLAIVKKQ
jgi:hypothetical protein